eukprot:gene17009-8514_t
MDSKKLIVPCLIFAIIVLAVGNVLQILYSKNIELRLENHLEKFAKFEVSCKDILAKLLRDKDILAKHKGEAFSSVGRNLHNTKDHKSLQNNKHEGFEVRKPRKLSLSNVLHEELNQKVSLPKGPPDVAVANNGIIFPQLKGKRMQKGERGPKGEMGDPGVRGKAGPQGNVGPRGPNGEKGDRGASGKIGGKGEKGDSGKSPRVICENGSNIAKSNLSGDVNLSGAVEMHLQEPVYMEASFPANRVSQLTVYMDSQETQPAGMPADTGGVSTSELIHLVGVGVAGSPTLDLTTAKTKEDARFKIWKTEAHHGEIRYDNGYIKIRVTGYYYVYCQIHYSGRFKFNRHIVKKNDHEPILLGLETFKRPTHIFDKNASTKFTGGIFRLIRGDQISVFGIATKYTLHQGSTYFGAYLLYQ